MRLRVVSWHGDTTIVDNGSIYKASLPDEVTGYFSQVSANVSFLKKEGATPQFLSQTPNEWYFPLVIQIVDRTDVLQASRRDALAKLFPTSAERNFERILIVKDIDDGDEQWQITGTPIAFKYNKDFIRIILAVAEPRWVQVSEVSDSDTYTTGSGITLSPQPKGNTEYNPILEITPSSQRTTANTGEELAHFVEIINPVGKPAVHEIAIDITDGGYDHANDVLGGDSLANGDDVRVEINGQTRNRWFDALDTSATKLWTHVSLPVNNPMKLRNTLSAGGDETEVRLLKSSTQRARLQAMPTRGTFKIGTERFTYTGKYINSSSKTWRFTGVKRGVLQSSKAAHAKNDVLTHIPNRIWVYQGDTTVDEEPHVTSGFNDFKPAFELSSTNSQWVYNSVFFDVASRRSWSFYNLIAVINPAPDEITRGETHIFTDNENTYSNPAQVLGQRLAAINDPYKNDHYLSIYASLSAAITIPWGIKDVTVEGRKARVGTESVQKGLWRSRGNGDWERMWNDITAPADDVGTWENLKAGVENTLITLDNTNGYPTIVFHMRGTISGGNTQNWEAWQIDKCTLNFNTAETPNIVDKFAGTGAGAAVVELKYVITNSATGDSIEVNGTIEINDTLVLDFQDFEFYILSDNQRLPFSVRPSGNITGHWFKLMGGEPNTITLTDADMPTTVMNVKWNARNI